MNMKMNSNSMFHIDANMKMSNKVNIKIDTKSDMNVSTKMKLNTRNDIIMNVNINGHMCMSMSRNPSKNIKTPYLYEYQNQYEYLH